MQTEGTQTNAEFLSATLQHQQSEKLGRIVDESVERAARAREERAERDRIEREAEERQQRLEYYRELELDDAQRLADRRQVEEQSREGREAHRLREERAQQEAQEDRANAMRHEWEA